MDTSDPRDQALRSLGYSITAPVLDPRPSRPPRPVRPAGAIPDGGTAPDHHATVRRLKGIAIVATAVTVGAFGGLVVNHRVGAAAPAAPAVTSGTVGAGVAAGSGQTVTPTDPFFDPNPGSGAGQDLAPAFGSGGGSPVFRSSGS